MNIQEVRKKYPQYNDLSDTQLATALHQKFYADLPFDDFSQKIGLQGPSDAMDAPVPSVPTQEQVARAEATTPQGPRTFLDTVKDRFSQVREGFKTPGVPMLHLIEPQVKFAKENPDVVAATAASIAVPPLAPVAGRLASLARFVPQIAAAGGGGAVGGAAKEVLNNPDATLDSIINQGVRSGVEMAAAEGAGIAATGLLSKIAAPGAKTLTEQGKKLIDFAKQHKLPLKPSAASPSLTAKGLEAGVEGFLPGRVFKQFANKKIANVLATNTGDANRLIANVSEVYGKNSPGLDKTIRSSTRVIKEGLEQWQPKVESKYLKFTEAIGGRDRWTDYPKLKSALLTIKDEQQALAGGADESIVKFIDNFTAKYPEQISADDLYKQYKRLGKIKGADRRNLGLIRDAFKEEFDDLATATGDNARSLLGEANKEYILGKRYFKNDPTIRKIASGDIDDAQVTVQLFRDSKYSTLKQLEANIPKENFINLQRLNLENLINNNSVKPEGTFVSILDGNKLLRWIDKNPKTFNLYPKETQEALRNLGLYAKLHGKDAMAGAKGFESVVGSAALTAGLAGGSFLATDPTVGLVVTSTTAPALAWSMMRPNSAVNKWLVKGEIGPFAKGINEGLRVGGRLVFQDSTNE